MKLYFQIALLAAFFFSAHCKAQTVQKMNQITQNGMTITWQIEPDRLMLRMTAPTDGWVAIGFNDREGLAGTNLIMGCVKNGKAEVSDRHILAPGDHRSINELGGASAVELIGGTEVDGTTTLDFSLPLRSPDRWHHDLSTGKTYHLLMAFSRDDDFAHHSMMRIATEISL
jgi:DOMON domain